MARSLRLVLLGLLLVASRAIPTAAEPAVGPLRVVFLVDSSSAVAPMINQFRAGMAAFLEQLPQDTEMMIVSTGGQLRVRVPPTTDRERLKKEIAGFAADGGANSFVDTMIEADKRFLKTAPDKRPIFVMLMTDLRTRGDELRADLYNRFVQDFMSRHGRAHGVVIHGVNMGVVTDVMMNLTSNTGGYYEAIAVANSLSVRMKQIADMVNADIP